MGEHRSVYAAVGRVCVSATGMSVTFIALPFISLYPHLCFIIPVIQMIVGLYGIWVVSEFCSFSTSFSIVCYFRQSITA